MKLTSTCPGMSSGNVHRENMQQSIQDKKKGCTGNMQLVKYSVFLLCLLLSSCVGKDICMVTSLSLKTHCRASW